VRFGVGGWNGVGRVCLSRRELAGRVERAAFDDDGAHAVRVEAGPGDRVAAEGDELKAAIAQAFEGTGLGLALQCIQGWEAWILTLAFEEDDRSWAVPGRLVHVGPSLSGEDKEMGGGAVEPRLHDLAGEPVEAAAHIDRLRSE
jgi:hypothetical protein